MDQRKVQSIDARDYSIGERLLINRTLQAAVFQTSPWHICQDGLPYDRCLVGVVTDMNREAWDLSDHDISSDEKFKSVMRTHIDLVLTDGVSVLNAEDPLVVDLAQYSDGDVIFYATDPDNEVMKAHRAEGRRNVYYRDGHVVLARGDQETLLFHLDFPPIAMRIKQDGFNLSTLLAGVACGWALDIAPLLIRAGLKNFGQKNSISPPLDIRTTAQ
jgi:cyanophycin synthetase